MSDDNLVGVSRRRALAGLAAAGAAGTVFASGRPALAAPNMCVLTPRAIQGPFYFDPKLVRGDIAEGKPGAPLRLRLKLVEARTCAPIEGARIDVWHADGLGLYSGYAHQGDSGTASTRGETFLRGSQTTDVGGEIAFTTIYPGWYPTRAPHVHFKIFLDRRSLLTGQMYFPDAVSDVVYRSARPYSDRVKRDTTNATDGVLRATRGGASTICEMSQEADRYQAFLQIGVDREKSRG
ncbi:MAG: intradiol ring-cleavage dioxygenase [Methylobacteriaceae bacterium]|nr:intradiol ring-cleavage dioxygenase [Methylobacteriaceae bacterium]MBV9244250.1 intradiol ring-cleavage dioxygenase [Methylobacteriaceae bacterium]MBV9637652.1 intradiol ring-cleavage dioxygenase [Methylobacteriaceae bacterium]MBV9701455.1 intradiol ring-cleavage dioxygenase [Methylobacteriaceae bacterium]